MTTTILFIVLLLAANGFFVAAEFALVKVRSYRLQSMVAEGRFGAAIAERMRADVEPYLAACQLGITMASLGLGWIGEPAVAAVLQPIFGYFSLPEATVHTVSFLIGFILFSSLHIVIGEQVPKTWAIRTSEDMVRWCAHTLYLFYLVVFPLNWLLNKAAGSILSGFNVQAGTHADVYSDRELQGMIETSTEHGEIEVGKAEMLANLFAFDERNVGRIMMPRSDVTVFDANASNEENLDTLRQTHHSRLPLVGANNTPLGIVLVKELYASMLDHSAIQWDQLPEIARESLVVPESLRIQSLFETMRSDRAHMALVVDEYGQFIGLVTMEDLIEEIVGEIRDETDEETTRYAVAEAGKGWTAHGLTPLSDVQRTVGLSVADDLNANTISGLLMQRLGRMPQEGDVLHESGFEIKVQAMDSHHVATVAIHQDTTSE